MAGVGVAALLAALFGLKAAGLLRIGASTPDPALTVRRDAPPPNLQIPAQVDPAPIQKEATQPEKVTMPADVRDYLEHVRKCEEEKAAIGSRQNAEAMVLLTKMQALGAGMAFTNDAGEIDPGSDENKDPQQYGKDKVLNFRPDWDRLVAFFNSKQPPAECRTLASQFNQALSEIPGMMGDISGLLNDVTKDPAAALQKANGLKGKSNEQIDTYFAQANDEKNAICAKYDTKPWFEIKKDVGAGGMFSAFGSMGAGGGLGGVSVPGG